MNKFSICVLFVLFAMAVSAQNSFTKGDNLVSLGVGLGSPYWGSGYSASFPLNPTITIEKGITNEISIGGTLSYSSSKFDYYDWKFNAYYIGARGAYHFDISRDNIDVYAGAGLGYVIVSVGSKSSGVASTAASGVGYAAFGGGKYYFNHKTAAYAELGYGSFSILNLGISFKF